MKNYNTNAMLNIVVIIAFYPVLWWKKKVVIDICVIEVGQLIINRYLLDSYVYGKKDDSSG